MNLSTSLIAGFILHRRKFLPIGSHLYVLIICHLQTPTVVHSGVSNTLFAAMTKAALHSIFSGSVGLAREFWELVIIDGAYLPHIHQKINSEFYILTGQGHLSRDADWCPYQARTRLVVGAGVAHGFITDPEFGATVFLSIQSEPIRKIFIDPATNSEKSEDDFLYADDAFPLPSDLLEMRLRKLEAIRGRMAQ